MNMNFIAATKLQDIMSPKERGDRVNAHVVNLPREPKPDFDAMRSVIQGRNQELAGTDDATKRKVSKGG